jgi:hypothetical protein
MGGEGVFESDKEMFMMMFDGYGITYDDGFRIEY